MLMRSKRSYATAGWVHQPRPPPIFVNEVDRIALLQALLSNDHLLFFMNWVNNIALLQALLETVAPEGYDMKIINSNNVEIMAKSKKNFYK